MPDSYDDLENFLRTGRSTPKHRVVSRANTPNMSMNSFNYPSQTQSFYIPNETIRKLSPNLPHIHSHNSFVPIAQQPIPYQKFVALPNFYETPRSFIPAEPQSSFIQPKNCQLTSQSHFFPSLVSQQLPVPSYGMTIQSPYYQAYPSFQFTTEKTPSYPHVKTVLVQAKQKPNYVYEKIDPRFKRYRFN